MLISSGRGLTVASWFSSFTPRFFSTCCSLALTVHSSLYILSFLQVSLCSLVSIFCLLLVASDQSVKRGVWECVSHCAKPSILNSTFNLQVSIQHCSWTPFIWHIYLLYEIPSTSLHAWTSLCSLCLVGRPYIYSSTWPSGIYMRDPDFILDARSIFTYFILLIAFKQWILDLSVVSLYI